MKHCKDYSINLEVRTDKSVGFWDLNKLVHEFMKINKIEVKKLDIEK